MEKLKKKNFITPKIKKKQRGQLHIRQCWRECGNHMADHFHVFRDCQVLQPYWQELVIHLITGQDTEYRFYSIYGGAISKINLEDKYLTKIMLTAGKKKSNDKEMTSKIRTPNKRGMD